MRHAVYFRQAFGEAYRLNHFCGSKEYATLTAAELYERHAAPFYEHAIAGPHDSDHRKPGVVVAWGEQFPPRLSPEQVELAVGGGYRFYHDNAIMGLINLG